MLPKANLLGLGVTQATPDEIVIEIGRLIERREGARTVAAVNVHTFMEARRSPRYRDALNDASVAFVDGVPIRWLLRATGFEAPPRIHGADLTALVLERLPAARHLFFGSTPETLGRLERAMTRRFPAVRAAGFVSPPFRRTAERESPEMLERINSAGADILWVALGAPKQEVWARLNRDALKVPVIACVGAAFDLFAGRYRRAPQGVQDAGLEWTWRLAQDPWRLWRRYFATNGGFAAELVHQWLVSKRPSRATPPGSS